MKHPPLLSLFLAVCLAVSLPAMELRAQEQTKETQPRRQRVVSPEVASALAAAMPKYEPPKPEEPLTEEELADLREVDRPRNTIIRLPEYVVQEKPPPVFRERDLHTQRGLADLAKRRFFSEAAQGLNRYRLPLFGQGIDSYALMMREEEERLQNITSLKETADAVGSVDPKNAASIRRATNDAYIRRDGFGYRRPQ